MTDSEMRLNGIYRQRQQPYCMMRIKLAGGVFSVRQARLIADLAERYARGLLHLTTRCSIELHWLEESSLEPLREALATEGLTSRGACGGAVRGVSVSSEAVGKTSTYSYALAEVLQKHYTGQARYEGLPKKFKIGIQSGYTGLVCRFQDIGLVVLADGPSPRFDVWLAGGLGREPQEGFLFATSVAPERLVPIIDATVGLYRDMTPPGKRLKHVVREIGTAACAASVRDRAATQPDVHLAIPPDSHGAAPLTVDVPVFAGELPAAGLRALADISATHGTGKLFSTPDQNIAVEVSSAEAAAAVVVASSSAGFPADHATLAFRVCPGSHECRVGLAPTRDIARGIIDAMSEAGRRRTWAISGCPNSCSQPQAADVGIVTMKLTRTDEGQVPLFNLYRKESADRFSRVVAEGISLDELLDQVERIGRP